MEEKPRVGLILIRTDLGELTEAAASVQALVAADAEYAAGVLRKLFDLRGPWVIDGPQALGACQQALRESELDMVVLAYQTQADEGCLADLRQVIGICPLVVWCYLPWRRFPEAAAYPEVLRGSGPAATFGALSVLRGMGASFLFTFGSPDDPRLADELRCAGRAAQVRRALRATRIGLLPAQDSLVQSSYSDPSRLMADFGPQVEDIPPEAFQQSAGALTPAQVAGYAALLRETFNVSEVAEEALQGAARAALGLASLAEERRLDVLAVSDSASGLEGVSGSCPSLYPTRLGPQGALYQPVAEPGAATANRILHLLTGSPTMLLELWFWDEPRNLVAGGHLGLQNPALATPGKVSVSAYRNLLRPGGGGGIQFEMMARAGRVTLFQLRAAPRGWQAIAATGMCLEGPAWVEGYTHAVVRLDAPLDHFLSQVAEVGAARHWVLAYGSVIPELEALCQMNRVPLEVIR